MVSAVENSPDWDDHTTVIQILGLCERRNGLPSDHVLSMCPETAELIQHTPEDIKYLLDRVEQLEHFMKTNNTFFGRWHVVIALFGTTLFQLTCFLLIKTFMFYFSPYQLNLLIILVFGCSGILVNYLDRKLKCWAYQLKD